MVRKHPAVAEKGRKIDLSDLEEDGVVMFQKKYYEILVLLGAFVIPAVVPWYFWQEDGWISYYTATIFRYTFCINITWCINSVAHLYGNKPYDKNIGPTENPTMMIIGFGEGFHNYHHTFPWDYKAAELGSDPRNLTSSMIEYFARIGWATELKTASEDMIRKRIKRTGDGTHDVSESCDRDFMDQIDIDDHAEIWGWGDSAMTEEEIKVVQEYNNIEVL